MLLYYGSLVGYFRALWLGLTHVLQIMLENCRNIEKHTRQILEVDYERLSGLADALLVNIADRYENNIEELLVTAPEGEYKQLAAAFIRAIQDQYKTGTPHPHT